MGNTLKKDSLINELQEKEEALKKAHQHIVSLQNDLLEFSYAVSHNLRGPVSSILGVFQLLEDAELGAHEKRLIEMIKEKAQTVDSIIYDLNNIVSLKKGVKDIFQIVDVKQSVNIIISSYQSEIKNRRVQIKLDRIEQNELLVSKESFYAILEAVIDNAFKHGTSAKNPVIEILSAKHQNYIQIQILDNGIGVDSEKHHNRLFKAYEKLNVNSVGKGLGLYMAKLQCEMLGGEISLYSKPAEGSRVSIKFPIRNEDQRHVLLESEQVRFVYFPKISTIKAVWKKSITVNEFDRLFMFILEFISKYKTNSWIADITNSFNNEEELNTVRQRFTTRIKETGLQRLAIVIGSNNLADQNNERNLERIQKAYSIPVQLFETINDAKKWVESENKLVL